MCTRLGETSRRGREAQGIDGLLWRTYRTPWGEGLVAADGQGLRFVELPRKRRGKERPLVACAALAAPVSGGGASGVSRERPASDSQVERILQRWVVSLEAYFRGERRGWARDEISWEALALGPFRRAVYEALLGVPCGTTVSYGELAEVAGHAGAARAVGSAMASNPIPVVIPCHRVIRADGSLGAYGDDPSWKPILLDHERAMVAGRRER